VPEQNGDRSQEPTPHRRQQAREEGHVAKSQDLESALVLLVSVGALLMFGGHLVQFLTRYAETQLGGQPWLSLDLRAFQSHWNRALIELARNLLPIFGLMLAGAILANLGQVGFLFLPEKVAFDLTRLDPLAGFGRLFSLSSVARLLFGLFKIGVIGAVAAVVVYQQRHAVLGLSALSPPQIAGYLIETLLWTTLKIAAALVVLAVLDYAFQRWKHERDLRMTPQEIREEMKNLEGNPQVLARRRAVQRQLAVSRLSSAVPKADVVVTNPTELAVAISYDPEEMAAPVVIAKGAGPIAERIRHLAVEHGIPIVEKKPLAQALYREVEINHPIPQDKYAAVAEVLAYVYKLKGKKVRTHAAA
jgi:flagellar biosynthetic protein FlhB